MKIRNENEIATFSAWVGSLACAGSGFFGPLAGKLYDRYGPRLVTFCGSLTCVVALLLTSQVPNLELMYLTFGLLYGLGSCFVYVAVFMIVPRYLDFELLIIRSSSNVFTHC